MIRLPSPDVPPSSVWTDLPDSIDFGILLCLCTKYLKIDSAFLQGFKLAHEPGGGRPEDLLDHLKDPSDTIALLDV